MGIKVGIVGIGPVGANIYRCIHELGLQCDEIRVMATSSRVEELDGEQLQVSGLGTHFCEENLTLFAGLDVVFFAGREGEKGAANTWAMPAIDAHGCYCIDNGADFRLDDAIPLIVPEVNMDAASADTKLIASPNCSTIQMCVALAPLHAVAKIKRVVVSTYQSVSGYGKAAQADMVKQLQALDPIDTSKPLEYDSGIFRKAIILDCLPHIDSFMDNGYTKEELKMRYETRKIFGDAEMDIVATTVRVPVDIGHAESINVQFYEEMSAQQAMDIWRDCRESHGIALMDDLARETAGWPTPSPPRQAKWCEHTYAEERSYPTQADVLKEEYKNLTLVGRTRDDYTLQNTINLWCVADNLRKGAATNVVQIAMGLVEKGIVG